MSDVGHLFMPQDILNSRWDCDSAPFPGMYKWGSRAGKTLGLRNQIRQFCSHFPKFPGQTRLCRWAKLLVGITSWAADINLICQDPCTGCCKSHALLTHSLISSGPVEPVQVLLQLPWNRVIAGAPAKLPTMPVGIVLPGFSFPTWGTRGSGETSPCGAALSWGERSNG